MCSTQKVAKFDVIECCLETGRSAVWLSLIAGSRRAQQQRASIRFAGVIRRKQVEGWFHVNSLILCYTEFVIFWEEWFPVLCVFCFLYWFLIYSFIFVLVLVILLISIVFFILCFYCFLLYIIVFNCFQWFYLFIFDYFYLLVLLCIGLLVLFIGLLSSGMKEQCCVLPSAMCVSLQ